MSRRYLVGWLASVGVACALGLVLLLLVGPAPDRRWWIAGIALSGGWLFASLGSRELKWAGTAAPAGVANIFAVFFLVDHGLTPLGIILLIVALTLSAVHVYLQRSQLYIPRG